MFLVFSQNISVKLLSDQAARSCLFLLSTMRLQEKPCTKYVCDKIPVQLPYSAQGVSIAFIGINTKLLSH